MTYNNLTLTFSSKFIIFNTLLYHETTDLQITIHLVARFKKY